MLLLALPEEEEELQHFRCSHQDTKGHLVVSPSNVAFLAYDQSKMFSLPIVEIASIRAARYQPAVAASDNSLLLELSNGSSHQFDGFWERLAAF